MYFSFNHFVWEYINTIKYLVLVIMLLFKNAKFLSKNHLLNFVSTQIFYKCSELKLNKNREVSQNWNFIKINWCLHHLKALNERISEWAHFLNVAKWFWRFLNFSAPKNWGFFRQDLEGTYLKWHQKDNFWRFFCNFLGTNSHNFVKNDAKL